MALHGSHVDQSCLKKKQTTLLLHPSSPTLASCLGSSMHVVCEGRFIFPCVIKQFLISLCSRFKVVKEALIDVSLSRVSSSQTERFLIFHGGFHEKMRSSFFILT